MLIVGKGAGCTPRLAGSGKRESKKEIEIPGLRLARGLRLLISATQKQFYSGSRALAWNTMSTVYPAETADIHPATFVTLRFSLDRMGHVKDAESRRTHVKAERLKETTRAIGNTLTRAAALG